MKKILILGFSVLGIILFSAGGYETVKSFSSIKYLEIIRKVKKDNDWEFVPDELTLATIETESSFLPDAVRQEPAINDASYGLMQVLYSTAKWLGYTGTPEGLLEPAENIKWGTAYHAYLFNKYSDWDAVIHAYNEGPGNYDKGKRVSIYFGRVIGRWYKWEALLLSDGETL